MALCAHTSLQYIERLGLPNIRAHARQLTERLQKELPAKGYASLTPIGNETPILAFQLKDVEETTRIISFGDLLGVTPPVWTKKELRERSSAIE